jgi:hypothetical protein
MAAIALTIAWPGLAIGAGLGARAWRPTGYGAR